MTRNALFVAVALCFLAAIVGCAKPSGRNSNVREIIDREHEFASRALERGVRSAFLEFLAEDGVIFRPDPVNGREWYLSQDDSDAYLGWDPVYADMSRAGDFGYTTGPWEYSENGEVESATVFGQYVSVWQRDGSGVLKVVIDMGTVNPRPAATKTRPATSATRSEGAWVGESDDSGKDRKRLERTEFEFAKLSRESGAVSAYGRYGDREIRLLRMDQFPLIGLDAVRRYFSGAEGEAARNETTTLEGSEVAISGDMGYTFGVTAAVGGSSYFRIWRRTKEGNWNIVLDMSIPRLDESDVNNENLN